MARHLPRLADDVKRDVHEHIRDAAQRSFDAKVAAAARRLRVLADDIEAKAAAGRADLIAHSIAYGVANLDLGGIMRDAIDAAQHSGAVDALAERGET